MRIRATLLLFLLILCVNVHAAGIVVDSSLGSGVRQIEVVGKYAYGATQKGLLIYDISIPAQPVFVSRFNSASGPAGSQRDVAVRYPYCYVSNGEAGLFVIDISDPQNPFLLGNYNTLDDARGVALYGDYAFVGVDQAGWDIIDISDPANPTLGANFPIYGRNSDIVIRDTIAFITHGDMIVLNIVNPLTPVVIGAYTPPWVSKGMHVEGTYAYVTDAQWGYHQVDISDITSPDSVFAVMHEEGLGMWDVDVVGQTLYGVGWEGSIQCRSTVTPTNPPVYIDMDPGVVGYGIHVEQNIAYVCCSYDGLIMFELQWRGDLNATSTITSTDIVFLVNYVFKNGTSPTPVNLADVNCDGQATASDIIYLVNYVFKSGDQPVCP